MWCVPKIDKEYEERMLNVLDLYEKEYNPEEPVICLDEKPLQLLEDVRPTIPAVQPGQVEKIDYEYKRMGTANVFCTVEPKAGRHFAYVSKRKTGLDFAKIIYRLFRIYRNVKTIHIVMDNYSTHSKKSLINRYGEEKAEEIWSRFTIHYTPKHASWLNQAEIEIGILSRQCLGLKRFNNIKCLRDAVNAWKKRVNKKKLKIDWKFTSEKAIKKFKLNK